MLLEGGVEQTEGAYMMSCINFTIQLWTYTRKITLKREEPAHLFLRRILTVIASTLLFLSYSVACDAEEYTSIKIFPEHVGVFTTVGEQQFVAFGYTSSGTSVNITEQVDWKSSNTDTATIDETGLATVVNGKTAGQVKITCSYPKVKPSLGKGTVTPIMFLLLKER